MKSRTGADAMAGFVSLIVFYLLVLVLGILSMGFQLLGSIMLRPHFGSAINVWAILICTFLLAFSVGSMLGGWISNRNAGLRFRIQIVTGVIAVAWLGFVAWYGRPLLTRIELGFDVDAQNPAVILSCLSLFLMPVTMLSTFGPQCVQYLASRGTGPGAASGLVYGISTVGNIGGVMLTAFFLIPHWGLRTLLNIWLVVAVVSLSGLILLLKKTRTSES